MVDNYSGSSEATKLLINRGRSNILVLSGILDSENAREKLRGFKSELERNGINFDEAYVKFGEYNSEFGYTATECFLKSGKSLDAVFAMTDTIAIGVIQALKAAGIHIPKDVSVVGFDNIIFSEFIDPPLTTVNQPKYEMGKIAVEMLFNIMSGNKNEFERSVTLATNMVIRKST